MKKIYLMLAAALMTAGIMSAQDINAVTEIYNQGAGEIQLGNMEAALGHFENALSQAEALGDEGAEIAANCKNTIPALMLSIAKDQIKADNYDGALDQLAKTIEKAKAYENAEVLADAEELVPQVNMQKGNNLIKVKDFAGAVAVFEQIVAADSTNAMAALRLGQSYMATGKTAEAENAYLLAARQGQDDQAYKQLSNMYVKQAAAALKAKKYADAIEAADKSNSYKENATAYKVAGTAASQAQKNAEAITYLEKYLELSPNAKDAVQMKYTIAATAQTMGDKAKAKEYYQMIVSDPKFGPTAQEMLKTL
ncbi:MAG: tetratricopeptide repeat protein [Bacteroidales bacterium]|nr:tetratricopeptide repeat protein [Bacteroidales bacterium]